jgi:TonB family protein
VEGAVLYDTTAIDEPPLPRLAPVVLPDPDPKRSSKGGRVKVGAIVGGDGAVEPASVVVIVPDVDSLLNEEAQRVVKSTAFWPGCKAGQPVRVRIAFEVAFHAGGPPTHPSWAIFVYLGLLAGYLFIPGVRQ